MPPPSSPSSPAPKPPKPPMGGKPPPKSGMGKLPIGNPPWRVLSAGAPNPPKPPMGGKPPPKSGKPPSPKSGMSPPNPPNLKGFSPRWLPDVVTLRVRSSIVILSLHLMPRHPSPVATMLRVPLPERRILSFAQMTADLLLAVSLQAVRVSVFSVPLAASISTFFLFFSQRGAPS